MTAQAAGPGTQAVRRVTTTLLGWVTVLTAPAWLYGIVIQAPAMAPAWDVAALVLVGASALALAVGAFSGAATRWPSVALATVVALAVATWPFAVRDPALTATRLPWLWLILPLALAAVVTLGSLLASLVYSVGVVGVFSTYRTLEVGGSGKPWVVAMEALLLLVVAAGLALLVRASRDAAHQLDAEAAQGAAAWARAMRAQAMADARAEVDAILHDRVLAALTLVVRSPTSPEIPPMARQALTALDALRADAAQAGDPPHVPVTDLAVRVAAAARLVDPRVRAVDQTGAGDVDVPEPVARAMVEAVAEAVRNSARHAGVPGRDLAVTVSTRLLGVAAHGDDAPEPPQGPHASRPEGSLVAVVVDDDGRGFDPADVAPERLGVEVSIHGRMRAFKGSAGLRSAPGAGTTVTLLWPAGAVA